MMLGELIAALEAEDPAKVVPHGFTNPHSWRGDYMDLAFEPARNVTVAAMLADAREALGNTYQGYKGGEYTMTEHTDCWLSEYGTSTDAETIGPRLLRFMLDAGEPPVPAEPATEARRLAETVIRTRLDDIPQTRLSVICEVISEDLSRPIDGEIYELSWEVRAALCEARVDATVSWPQADATESD
jgi:hypothetical protein